MVWAYGERAIERPIRDLTGVDAVRNKIRLVFASLAGEWPADVTRGLPEDWVVEGRRPTPQAVAVYIRRQLFAIAEVASVPEIRVTVTETITVTARIVVRTVDGLVDLTVGEPLPYDTRGAPALYVTSGTLRHGRGPAWQGA